MGGGGGVEKEKKGWLEERVEREKRESKAEKRGWEADTERERWEGKLERERESINKLYFYGVGGVGGGAVMKRQTDRQVGRERRFSNWILTSCDRERERQIDRQTDRDRERQRQIETERGGGMERQTDRQADRGSLVICL